MNTYQPTCDDNNPAYMFSSTYTDLLVAAANGQVDLLAFAKRELANRGLDQNGQWVGFDNAAKIWKA
jgi:hypothetical protein